MDYKYYSPTASGKRILYIISRMLSIPFRLEPPRILKGFPERLEETHDLTGLKLKDYQKLSGENAFEGRGLAYESFLR